MWIQEYIRNDLLTPVFTFITQFRKLPKKFGIPILIFAIIMGFTRLYLGVHYPTDVIFAVFEGIAISYIVEAIVNGVIKIVKTSTKS